MAQAEDVRQPDLRNRIVAAAGASIVSALLVNPLDVIKTRVQAASIVTDRPLPTCQLTRFPVRWSRPASLPECASKLPAAAAGPGAAGCLGAGGLGPAAGHLSSPRPLLGPLQLPRMSSAGACACALKVADLGPDHLRAPESCHNARLLRPVTASGVLRDIVRKEGVAALWRGTDTAMLANIPMVGVYMPLYDYLLQLQRATDAEGPRGGGASGYAPLVAGSAARTLAVLLVAPLELVRTRQQGSAAGARTAWAAVRETLRDTGAAAAASGGGRTAAAGAAAASAQGLAAQGLRAAPRLWTGVGATLARDVPFSAIYWGLVERIRSELLARWKEPVQAPPLVALHRPMGPSSRAVLAANLIAGSAAGAVAALVTTPFDVVKTRLQVGDVRGGGGDGGGLSSGRASGLEVAHRILRQEGVGGLFRGWAPRAARTAPACAVVVASYEVLKMWS